MNITAKARFVVLLTSGSWAALLAAGAAGLGGCSSDKHTVVYNDAPEVPSGLVADSCAIGGIVMHYGYGLDALSGVDVPPGEFSLEAQSDLWAPVLESAFMESTGRWPAVGWYRWSESLPEDTRARMLYYLSRHTLIPPEILGQCRSFVPQARWLIMVTIDKSMFEVDMSEGFQQQHASARRIWLQLDVYDLAQGHSIWTSRLSYRGAGPRSPSDATETIDRWEDAAGSGEVPNYVITNVLSGPPLRPTLDKALVRLLAPMVRHSQPAGADMGEY